MKFAASALTLTLASTVSAADNMSIRGNTKASQKLMQHARLLQNNGNGNGNWQYGYYRGQQGDNENSYLMGYSLKMLSCVSSESTVVFRLCPVDSCDDSSRIGCYEGYGDYSVSLTTFMEAYMEGQQEEAKQQQNQNGQNGNNGDYQNGMVYYDSYGQEFDAAQYASQCQVFQMNNNNNGDGNQNYAVYVGPTCTSDGQGIRLGLFKDAYCISENTSTTFDELTGGAFSNVPYFDESSSSTSLVPNTCQDCLGMNANYEYEVSQVCVSAFESASARCEDNMDHRYSGYQGKTANDKSCSYLNGLLSATGIKSSGSSAEADSRKVNSSKKLTWDLNDDLFWDLIVLILGIVTGIAIVMYCVSDKVVQQLRSSAKEADSDDEKAETTKPSIGNSIKDGIATAAVGAKLAVATAAATTVTAIRNVRAKVSPPKDEETIADGEASEYNNMEELPTVDTAVATTTTSTGGLFTLNAQHASEKSGQLLKDDAVEDEAFEIELKKAKGARKMFGKMKGAQK